jgi:hypothetical protein
MPAGACAVVTFTEPLGEPDQPPGDGPAAVQRHGFAPGPDGRVAIGGASRSSRTKTWRPAGSPRPNGPRRAAHDGTAPVHGRSATVIIDVPVVEEPLRTQRPGPTGNAITVVGRGFHVRRWPIRCHASIEAGHGLTRPCVVPAGIFTSRQDDRLSVSTRQTRRVLLAQHADAGPRVVMPLVHVRRQPMRRATAQAWDHRLHVRPIR